MTLLSISLAGCWNYREIDNLHMVSGFAVDKSKDGKFLITAETVNISTGNQNSTFAPLIFSAEGETMLDAIRNIIIVSGRKLYWSHAKAVIISQDIAREGIIQVLDLITRDPEPRLELIVMISKEKTAKEIFLLHNTESKLQGFEIDVLMKTQKSLSKTPTTKVYQLVNSLSNNKESVVLPTIGFVMNAGKKNIGLSGAAIFKKDKLVGFLDGEETKYVLFVKNQIRGGILPLIKLGETSRSIISLEIFRNKTKIKPVYSNGKITINVDIKTRAAVDEQGTSATYIDPKSLRMLEKEAGKSLKNNIEDTIRKVQKKYGADIFGFGNEIKITMPSLWKSIAHDWDSLYRDLDVEVKASIDIRNTGLTMIPIK
ncbi:Ger(x)C family spore germination protein [Phosphitispora sp. TUW77]|uniref:Ger(x)C family spore germination protein n=1 Tax=Phosphitispora sp. TUW77 TaxID=3152361 RepID=UPI003AB2C1D0